MTKENKNLAKVYHADLYGLREDKYKFLKENSIDSIEWTEIPAVDPNYFFVEKDFDLDRFYKTGFSCNSLFITNGVGMTTAHDEFVIKDSYQELLDFYKEFQRTERNADILHRKFNVKKKKGWNILAGYDNIKSEADLSKFIKAMSYRPFDNKYIFYEDKLVWRTVRKVMQHFLKGENVGLLTVRQSAIDRWEHVGITNLITDDSRVSNRTRERGYVFPLYLYPDDGGQQSMEEKQGRKPNLNMEIVKEIEEKLGLKFVPEKEETPAKTEGTHSNTEGTLSNSEGTLSNSETPQKTEETLSNSETPQKTEETHSNTDTPAKTEGTLSNSDTPANTEETLSNSETPQKTEETPPNLPKGEALRGISPSSGGVGEVDDGYSPSFGGVGEVDDGYSPSSGGVGEVLPSTREVSSYQKPGYVTANPATYRYIKVVRDELKANPTKAENILWEYLRNKKTGYKIRRQHIIANFIADFVCLKEKLIIEIDGGIHNEQKEYDVERTKILNGYGYKVVRFSNDDILEDPQKVALQIKNILEKGIAFASESNEENTHHSQGIHAQQDTHSKTEDTPAKTEGTPPNLPKGEALRGISPSSGGVGEVSFAPIDLLDYIYAVLHSPSYREKYKEFLKIDFPRVPYPYDVDVFWKLVALGSELRQIHLLESPKVTQYITSYPNDGDNVVTRSLTKKSPGFEMTDEKAKTGRVWINDQQYFDGVPEIAYNFYIGGYQPAQKWLKDRKKRKLSFEDIMHYQKIIVALTETDRIMKEIDKIEVEG